MWFALIGFFILLAFLFACMQIAFSIVLPKTRRLENTKELELKKDNTLFEFYDQHLSKTQYLKTKNNYSLKLYYFLQEKSNDFVVIAHGHTYTHHGCIKYARMMYRLGFNVITFDQRYHGDSEGKNSTLGFYEMYDLLDVINQVHVEFGEDISLGLYGESMGAATILLEQATDKRVKFCISDCGFSYLSRLIKEQLKRSHLPGFVYFFVNIFVKIITGIKLEEVSPIKALAESNIPILFIHGEADKFISYHHSQDMFDSYKGKKAIFIAQSNATHAYSYFADTLNYEESVKNFLKENYYDKV